MTYSSTIFCLHLANLFQKVIWGCVFRVCICMCIGVYVCVCVCNISYYLYCLIFGYFCHVCMYLVVCVLFIHIHMHKLSYAYVCVCLRVHCILALRNSLSVGTVIVSAHIFIHASVCVYLCMYVCVCVCVCMCVCMYWRFHLYVIHRYVLVCTMTPVLCEHSLERPPGS